MNGHSALNLFHLFCKVFNRLFLALLLGLAVAAWVFDRLVMAEIPRAFPSHVTVADAQLRRIIEDTFEFRPGYAEAVHETFAQHHPGIGHFLGCGLSRALVGWCVHLHESSRLEATLQGTTFFDRDAEMLKGLDAASSHWLGHGIESATPQEFQALKAQLFSPTHPAWPRYAAKHPAGEGV